MGALLTSAAGPTATPEPETTYKHGIRQAPWPQPYYAARDPNRETQGPTRSNPHNLRPFQSNPGQQTRAPLGLADQAHFALPVAQVQVDAPRNTLGRDESLGASLGVLAQNPGIYDVAASTRRLYELEAARSPGVKVGAPIVL